MPHINKLPPLSAHDMLNQANRETISGIHSTDCRALLCRRVKLIEPACTTEQASSLTAAAAKGYQRLKDDTAAGLLLAMTGR